MHLVAMTVSTDLRTVNPEPRGLALGLVPGIAKRILHQPVIDLDVDSHAVYR